MYGWRLRIGVLIPSTNTVVESELNRMVPRGVSLHAARMMLTETTAETLTGMVDESEEAAERLATAKVDIILYACTSGSFVGGVEWEENITRKISKRTGIPAITTAGSVVAAFQAIKAKKVSMATPYIKDLHEREISFFSEKDFDIIASEYLGLKENTVIGSQYPEKAYGLAKKSLRQDTDTIFISCTDLRSIEILQLLENETGRSVISSNQASLWMALRQSGIQDKLEGFGSLFFK